jgi:uncharacterized protein (DUF1684 family)
MLEVARMMTCVKPPQPSNSRSGALALLAALWISRASTCHSRRMPTRRTIVLHRGVRMVLAHAAAVRRQLLNSVLTSHSEWAYLRRHEHTADGQRGRFRISL